MSKNSANYSPNFYDNQNSDKTDIRNTINSQQQNGHVPNHVRSAKIENFSSLASSTEEVARIPDVKISNIIGNAT